MRGAANVVGRLARAVGRWYSIPLLLCLWQVASVTGLASPRILPGLDVIAAAFWVDLVNGALIANGAVSLMRAMIGYGLAALVGVALGTAMARSRVVDELFEPIFFFGYPVPKIALFPIFTFVFGIGTPSKVAFIFLECLYPITVATLFAIRHVDKALIWSARSMGAGRSRVFWRVLLPAAAPAIYAGLRIALPISIIVVIITEMIGDTTGLGYYITYAATSFEYPKVYAGIAAVGILGFTLDRLFAWSRRHLLYWEKGTTPGL